MLVHSLFKTNKMKVNKLIKAVLITVCVSTTIPAFSNTLSPGTEPISATTKDSREAYVMNRLHEIREMSKHNLSRAEKKELRKEVKQLKKEVRANKNGIYLSLGAAIIIALLLIILL
jgi:hypothetical protein